MAHEVIPYSNLKERLGTLKGCYIDHDRTHAEAEYVTGMSDRDPHSKRMRATIYLVVFDSKAFYDSNGEALLNMLHQNEYDVKWVREPWHQDRDFEYHISKEISARV